MSSLATTTSTLFILSTLLGFSRAGNTTQCASEQLDWYTSVVGVNPCQTYESLRQLCQTQYEVPAFSGAPPGDHCDDQSLCCCNSIAFQLSMLCLNCQHDTVNGYTVGVDAPKGTYAKYLNGCQPTTFHQLDSNVLTSACNRGIRLDNFLWGGWDDGSWFYVWTKENAGLTHAENDNNTFTHCANEAVSTSIAASATSTSITPAASTSSAGTSGSVSDAVAKSGAPSGGTIAGIVIGVLCILAIAAFAVLYTRRSRRLSQQSTSAFRWRLSKVQQVRPASRNSGIPYSTQSIPPSPVSVLTNPYSIAEPSFQFSQNLMVRDNPRPTAPPPLVSGRRQRRISHDDSRVGEPIDDAPDPQMPLMPLRLEEKSPIS